MTSALDLWSDQTLRRQLGAYYTPPSAARLMTDWVTREGHDTILEPSFGDGVFLEALLGTAVDAEVDLRVIGAEIDPDVHGRAVARSLIDAGAAHLGDFLEMTPIPVASAVGNPPYVRLRHLPTKQRDQALSVARTALGHDMDPSGSVWMPFVLHACEFLRPDGKFALVLPYDLTYVRYARPLWSYLGKNFGRLHLVRVHERLFPEILQDTVILFAEGKGRSTSSVTFEAFERVQDLLDRRPSVSCDISVDAIVSGDRPFLRALLARELLELLDDRLTKLTVPARDMVTFNIGYVAGDKRFFHPEPATIANYGFGSSSLRPALTSTRRLSGHGLRTSALAQSAVSQLFYPPEGALPEGEAAYVAQGERTGVNSRYKCRIRTPWYKVPYVRIPDVVVSVFAERPLLLVNDARFVASNSLLCGYMQDGAKAEELAASWYTSLTLLQTELEVHSLGGGVFVLVPNEVGRIRIPHAVETQGTHLAEIHRHLAAGDTRSAYSAGDTAILGTHLGLSASDVDLIRDGAARLAHWRLAAQAR